MLRAEQAEPPPQLNIVIVEGEGAVNNLRQRVVRPSQAAPVLYARAPEVLWDLSIAPVRSMDDKTGFRRVENPPSHLTPAR
jgi:hypothetical protein